MSTIPLYQISNDPSCDPLYARIFTEPGILVVHEFPLTKSRFRILRESYSYDEIVDELRYCIRGRESDERLARLIIDDLLLEEASFLYPEMIRVAIDASIATVVMEFDVQQRLLEMFPDARIFYVPDDDLGPVIRASETLKRMWNQSKPALPWHLRPLEDRVKTQREKRLGGKESFCDCNL
jgi:hypothetical protein